MKTLIVLLLAALLFVAVVYGEAQRGPQPCKQDDLDAAFSVLRQNGIEMQQLRFSYEQSQAQLRKVETERDQLKAQLSSVKP